jgi:hypothetical protein
MLFTQNAGHLTFYRGDSDHPWPPQHYDPTEAQTQVNTAQQALSTGHEEAALDPPG